MAGRKISSLTNLASVADNDVLPIVDVSDTTGGTSGTTKKVAKSALISNLTIAQGGTGGTTAAGARAALGLEIGTDVLAYDPELQQIANLTDPDADKLLFWDDSADSYAHLSLGTNLSITGTTINATGGGGGGGSGETVAFTVSQASHGFSVGDVLKSAGAPNNYELAQADTAAHAEVVGIVSAVADADTFTLTVSGLVEAGVPAQAEGTVLFLSPTTPGALTATEPTTVGQVSKPLAVITENAAAMVFTNFRGLAISDPLAGGGGGGGSPITVEEIDGGPSVGAVTTIRVTNGTLTDDGAGQVTISTGGSGDVTGPASATDNALARFDSTTGKLIQNSGVTLGDTNNIAGLGTVSSGAITSTGTSSFGALSVSGAISSGAITSTGASSFGSLSLTTDLALTHGGTGVSSAAAARTVFGLEWTVATSQSGYMADYICDANTDDQSTTTQTIINNALLDLEAAGGGTLTLRAGTYYLKTPGIAVPSNCTLQGEGFGTILYRSDGSAYDGTIHNLDNDITTGTGNTGITIRNLMIDGNSAGSSNPGGTQNDIVLMGCTNSLVDNVYLYDSCDSAIVLDYNNLPVYSHNNIVRNCFIDTTQDIGIYMSNPNSNIIQGNIILNTPSYGIRVIKRDSGQAYSNQVLGNRIYNCGQTLSVDGIIVDGADTTQVVGNYVRQAGRNGILIKSAAYCNVSSNYVYDSDFHGIYLDSGVRSTVTGNTVFRSGRATSNTYSGIALNAGLDNAITGNRSGDDGSGTRQKYGVQEVGSSDLNTIVGNNLDRNGTAGLLILGTGTIAHSNRNATTNQTQANEVMAGYLRVGSLTAPSNTTAGDLTIERLFVSSDTNLYRSTTDTLKTDDSFHVAGTLTVGSLGGVLKASSGVVSGSASTTDLTEGTNLYYTDARVRLNRLDQMAAPTASVAFNSQKITGLADPANAQEAATKAYVDSVAQGLDAKASCRVATTANITLSGTQTIDGVAVIAGDRVLVKNQSTAADNGIYDVAAGSWSRSSDADTDAEVTTGLFTFITSGTTQANTGWVLTTTGTITLGSTALTFAQFSAAADITAGAGLTKTGTTIDVVGTSNRITVAADSIDIASTYLGQTSITTLGTITTGTWNATDIAVADGGTGASTATDARTNLGLVAGGTGDIWVEKAGDTLTGSLTFANNTGIIGTAGDGVTTQNILKVDTAWDTVISGFGNGIGNVAIKNANAFVLQDAPFALKNGSTITVQYYAASGDTLNAGYIRVGSTVVPTNTTPGDVTFVRGFATSMALTGAITGATGYNGLVVTPNTGVITSGTWNGTAISTGFGGTGASTATTGFNNLSPATTQGDLIYHNGTNHSRLPKGTALQVLRMNAGATAPEWAANPAGYRNLVTLGSDIASTAFISFQDITGLSFSVTSGTNYRFYAIIPYTASASTIGLRVSLTAPATTLLAYTTRTGLSATGSAANEWQNYQSSTDAGTVSTSSVATTAGNVIILEGFIRPSASGTVQLRFAPETATASGIVIKAGATLEWW